MGELKEGKQYIIEVTTKFDGEFRGYEDRDGVRVAIFQQAGRTDRGSIPRRIVPVTSIVSSELIKH